MTVLEVDPAGFDTAARVFGGDVAGGIGAVVEVLLAALGSCAGMAGTDDTAQAWSPHYDSGARAAITAADQLITGAHRLAALLEQCAINYAGAEAACLPGQITPMARAHWAHLDDLSPARHDPPPAAAGLALPEPEGWSLLAHLIGRLWPNGHQDLLHTAADAWHTAAATLYELNEDIVRASAALTADQHAPELHDATTVLSQYGAGVAQLSLHCRHLGDACTDLATALDHAHSAIERDCLNFVNTTIAAEAAGGLFAVVTAGLSEAAAQAVVLRAGYAAASAIRATIDAFASVMVGVAADLDTLAAQIATLSRSLEPTLARTTVQAAVTRPGIAGVVMDDRVTTTALSRLERGLQVSPPVHTWANPARLMQHFIDHAKEFGAATPSGYARMAQEFLERSRLGGLPTKVDQAGVIRIYEPATNTFGVYNADGRTITFFKPTSKTYWERQKGTPR